VLESVLVCGVVSFVKCVPESVPVCESECAQIGKLKCVQECVVVCVQVCFVEKQNLPFRSPQVQMEGCAWT
jgi:hypothetical protein